MRLLYSALQAGNRSGTGRYTEELLRALVQQAAPDTINALWPRHLAPPTQLPASAIHPQPTSPAARLRRILLGIPGAPHADLVHFPATFTEFATNLPAIYTIHDIAFLRHPAWFRPDRAAYYRWALRRVLTRATRVIADSHATAHDLIQHCHYPKDRIDVVHLGIDPAFTPAPPAACAALRARLALPDRFLLYVGTHEPRKNLPRLIEAFDQIAPELEHDLVIAGRPGWKTGPIHQALSTARHRARIHLPGYIPQQELPTLLTTADGLAWPSLFEGFGFPPLEAMACGTPVLTGNTASLPEICGKNAILIDPTSTTAIANGLHQLARAATNQDFPPDQLRAHAATYTWARTAAETTAAYHRALAP